jgi:hypothetical protein
VQRALRPYRRPVLHTVLSSVRRAGDLGHRAFRRLRGTRDRRADAGR